MTDPAPSPPAGQPPVPVRPMPTLGHGVVWSDVLAKIEADQAERTPSLGATGSSLGVPADAIKCSCSDCRRTVPIADLIRAAPAEFATPIEPPAVELLAMADDLNAHGGLDETFVAGLLQAAAGGSEGGDAPENWGTPELREMDRDLAEGNLTINDARERLGLPRLELEPAIPLPPRPGWLARTLRRLFT